MLRLIVKGILEIVKDTQNCFHTSLKPIKLPLADTSGDKMGNKDIIIDNPSLESRYCYGKSKCSKCKERFIHGDIIHTHKSRKHSKIYHKECWELLYH